MPCADYASTSEVASVNYEACACPDHCIAGTQHEDAILNEADVKCQCEAGYYMEVNQDGESYTCAECPLHTYNPDIGSISRKHCVSCPRHSITLQNASSLYTQCVCPTFGYFDVNVSLEATTCLCPQGRFMNALARTCDACPQGRYGTHEGTETVEDCLKCPRHADTDGVASQGFESCKCPHFSTLSSTNATCECEAGRYMDIETRQCELCPSGKYSGVVGIESVAQCEACPRHFKPNTPGITAITECACPDRSSAVESSYEVCECEIGYYMDQGDCTACAVGRYGTETGRETPQDCIVCARFATTDEEGSQQKESCVCPARSTMADDWTRCECQVGTYVLPPYTSPCILILHSIVCNLCARSSFLVLILLCMRVTRQKNTLHTTPQLYGYGIRRVCIVCCE